MKILNFKLKKSLNKEQNSLFINEELYHSLTYFAPINKVEKDFKIEKKIILN